MIRYATAIALLASLPSLAEQNGAYLHWNIDHTQRTPHPAHPLSPDEAAVVNHYAVQYDGEGRLSKVTFMHKGKPASGGDHGAASVEFHYTPDKTTETYSNPDGSPASARGIFRKVYHHAGGGFWTHVTFENEDGSPAKLAGGYSEVRVIRDEAGRVIKETRHDREGGMVPEHNGFPHANFVYDDRGFARYRQFADDSGKLQNGSLGYARVAFKFDPHGNFLEEHAEDASGEPATLSAGFHRIEWREFNQYGMPARVYYFDTGGYVYQPYAFSVREYLPTTQRSSIAYFGPMQEPVMHPQGFHRINYEYAEDGSVLSRTRIDTAGNIKE